MATGTTTTTTAAKNIQQLIRKAYRDFYDEDHADHYEPITLHLLAEKIYNVPPVIDPAYAYTTINRTALTICNIKPEIRQLQKYRPISIKKDVIICREEALISLIMEYKQEAIRFDTWATIFEDHIPQQDQRRLYHTSIIIGQDLHGMRIPRSINICPDIITIMEAYHHTYPGQLETVNIMDTTIEEGFPFPRDPIYASPQTFQQWMDMENTTPKHSSNVDSNSNSEDTVSTASNDSNRSGSDRYFGIYPALIDPNEVTEIFIKQKIQYQVHNGEDIKTLLQGTPHGAAEANRKTSLTLHHKESYIAQDQIPPGTITRPAEPITGQGLHPMREATAEAFLHIKILIEPKIYVPMKHWMRITQMHQDKGNVILGKDIHGMEAGDIISSYTPQRDIRYKLKTLNGLYMNAYELQGRLI